MPCPLAAFQETRVPLTSRYTWTSSEYSADPRDITTGNFPIGVIVMPFTARGVTSEGSKLSWSSDRLERKANPATDTSAPESGKACTREVPFNEDMRIGMVGAGSFAVE